MPFTKLNAFKVLFEVFCSLVVISMISFWMVKYFKDEDLCLVDYKSIQDFEDESLPALSICFYNPFIESKLRQIDQTINGTSYLEYLRGNIFDEKFKRIDYENVTLNLKQYVALITVGWKNGTTMDYLPSEAQEIVQVEATFNGFIYGAFTHCFGTVVNDTYKKDITYVANFYKRDDVLDALLVRRGNAFLILHYPNQFLLTPINIKEFTLESNRTSNPVISYAVQSVEILKRRNKRRDHCTPGFINFDEIVAKSNECRPAYLTKYKDIPLCSSQKKINQSQYDISARNNKIYTKPCASLSKIDFTYSTDSNWKDDTDFGIALIYPEQSKIISQTQAVDLHSLVGNIGGYIGLFLGTP